MQGANPCPSSPTYITSGRAVDIYKKSPGTAALEAQKKIYPIAAMIARKSWRRKAKMFGGHHSMPITITISGSDASEVKQLVQDLASTISGMRPEDIPVDTNVSTIEPKTPTNKEVEPVPNITATAAPAPKAPVVPVASVASTTAPTAAPAVAPTAVPTYDFNQLATATMQLQQAGQNIFELFGHFGIQALNQLPKERYAEYAAALRERGAKI